MKIPRSLIAGLPSLALAAGPVWAVPQGNAPPVQVGTTSGTVAAGNDGRIVGALQSGKTTQAVTGGTVTLNTVPQTAALVLTGALTGALVLQIPAGTAWHGAVVNQTTGAYGVTLQVAGQSAPALILAPGATRQVTSDGATLSSPLSEATNGPTTPTTTTTGDLAVFGGIDGKSLTDGQHGIGPNDICPVNSATPCAFVVSPTVNGTPLGGGAAGSMVINGDMDVDQQFEGASSAGGIDLWSYQFTTAGGLSLQRVTDAPPGYSHSLKMTSSSTAVTPAAADVRVLRQPLEGSQVQALAWGQTNTQPATASFWAKASVAGTYAFYIENSTGSYSYVGTYTITATNAWQSFAVTIPAAPAGAPFSAFIANNYGIRFGFDLGTGSSAATSYTGAWQSAGSSGYRTAAGATSLVATASATLQITGVHLYAGSAPGQYIPRPYAQELVLAQRYYAKTFKEGVAPAQNAGVAGALCGTVPVAASFLSLFRTLPNGIYTGSGSSLTVTTYNPSAANANFRDITAGADVTASIDPAAAKGGTGTEIVTAATVATAGDHLCIHAVIASNFK